MKRRTLDQRIAITGICPEVYLGRRSVLVNFLCISLLDSGSQYSLNIKEPCTCGEHGECYRYSPARENGLKLVLFRSSFLFPLRAQQLEVDVLAGEVLPAHGAVDFAGFHQEEV